MATKENEFINSLQKMDLNSEEAQIYFTLLQYGKKGTVVRKLREELPHIERTTIYSILKRLTEKDCVKSDDSKKLKTFIAVNPAKYFKTIYLKKKREFEELQEIKNDVLENLQYIYDRGLQLSKEELDPFILPYIEALLDNGWKIKSQKIEEGINVFGAEMCYEYQILPPKNLKEKMQMLGLLISIYETEIESDEAILKFFLKQIKKTIKELHQEDFDNIQIKNDELEILGNKFPSLHIRAREKKSNAYLDFGSTIIIPIENKVFFIWEEINHEGAIIDQEKQELILKDMCEPILRLEGTS